MWKEKGDEEGEGDAEGNIDKDITLFAYSHSA